jgi:hypothetical protein
MCFATPRSSLFRHPTIVVPYCSDSRHFESLLKLILLWIMGQWNERNYIWTIFMHCRQIWILFAGALETGRKVSMWRAFQPGLFLSEHKWVLYLLADNARILCYHARPVKVLKTTAKLSEKKQKQASLYVFSIVSSITSALMLVPFLIVGLHKYGIRKATCLSVTAVYKKTSPYILNLHIHDVFLKC